jgi:lipopolysaccharide export system protein LptA
VIQLPRLELKAQHVEARYEARGELRSLSGDGGVALRLDETDATATSFQFEVFEHRLKLIGPVRIGLSGGWMNAERADLDTQTGRITLHRVSGSMAIGGGAARALDPQRKTLTDGSMKHE